MTMTLADALIFAGLLMSAVGLYLLDRPLALVFAGLCVTYAGLRRLGG